MCIARSIIHMNGLVINSRAEEEIVCRPFCWEINHIRFIYYTLLLWNILWIRNRWNRLVKAILVWAVHSRRLLRFSYWRYARDTEEWIHRQAFYWRTHLHIVANGWLLCTARVCSLWQIFSQYNTFTVIMTTMFSNETSAQIASVNIPMSEKISHYTIQFSIRASIFLFKNAENLV